MRKLFYCAGLLSLFILTISPSNVSALTFNLDYLYDGATSPLGASPWLTATFQDDTATGGVSLTLSSESLMANENVVSWYFNFSPDISGIVPIQASGPLSQILIGEQNAQSAGSASGFDIAFSFSQGFTVNQSATYTLFGTGLSASSFDFVNEGGSFFSAAQINGIGANSAIAWIADSQNSGPGPGPGPAPVPEPATVILLGIALTGLTFFSNKRKTA